MSDSEEEFASADEEVNDEVEKVKGDSVKAEDKEKAKTVKKKRESSAKVSDAQQGGASGGDVKDDVKADDASKKVSQPIQRQPTGGYSNVEQSKDPRNALDNLATKENSSSGGSWGSWGTSIWGTARSSVSAFTTQLGTGIHSVVETVESALDVPPPEEIAEADAAETEDKTEDEKKSEEKDKEDKGKTEAAEGSWWGVTTSMMTSAQKTTRGIMTGGLDVLETIGKKTMEALHETDPGLARTRDLFSVGGRSRHTAGATLSQALREARERNEEAAQLEKRWEAERRGHFGAQFEDCQGLAHLEALELLASRAEAKLHSRLGQLTGDNLSNARQSLVLLKTAFERLEEEEEEEDEEAEGRSCEETYKEVEHAMKGLQMAAKDEVMRVIKIKEDLISEALATRPECEKEEEKEEEEKDEEEVEKTEEEEKKDEEEKKAKEEAKRLRAEEVVLQALLQAGVQILAHATASWVGLFHKIGELALADALRWCEEDSEEIIELLVVSERLVSCALLASTAIGSLGEEVAALLRKHSSESSRRQSTQLVSAIYLETGNSKSYVRDALVLLLPVVQLASLQ